MLLLICLSAVGVQQDPVAWCQDPVGVQQDPVGVQRDPVDPVGQDPVVWCQDPVVWCLYPVSQDPVGKVFKQPTYKEYTRNVFKPGQEAQCRNAAQADGLAVYQLPQDVLPELKVIAAIIYITRVYCSMIFHSVKQHKTPKKETLYTTQYATGQRLQVLLAKTVKGTLDLSLKTLSTYTAVNSQLKDEDKAKVDEHKAVLTKYFTRLLPVLRNLMDRPLNALASIINDPVNQREMIGEGEEQQMLIEPAQQAAPPQAPHTDFKPVAADQDDGLVFLLACEDFDLVAYMYSHLLMEQAAPYYKNGKPDLHSLGAVAAHAVLREGTLVKVKAGQLVLFRGNTVHAGTAGRPDSCGARLYGFAKTGNCMWNAFHAVPILEYRLEQLHAAMLWQHTMIQHHMRNEQLQEKAMQEMRKKQTQLEATVAQLQANLRAAEAARQQLREQLESTVTARLNSMSQNQGPKRARAPRRRAITREQAAAQTLVEVSGGAASAPAQAVHTGKRRGRSQNLPATSAAKSSQTPHQPTRRGKTKKAKQEEDNEQWFSPVYANGNDLVPLVKDPQEWRETVEAHGVARTQLPADLLPTLKMVWALQLLALEFGRAIFKDLQLCDTLYQTAIKKGEPHVKYGSGQRLQMPFTTANEDGSLPDIVSMSGCKSARAIRSIQAQQRMAAQGGGKGAAARRKLKQWATAFDIAGPYLTRLQQFASDLSQITLRGGTVLVNDTKYGRNVEGTDLPRVEATGLVAAQALHVDVDPDPSKDNTRPATLPPTPTAAATPQLPPPGPSTSSPACPPPPPNPPTPAAAAGAAGAVQSSSLPPPTAPPASAAVAPTAAAPGVPPVFRWGRDGLVLIIALELTRVLVIPDSHHEVLLVEAVRMGRISEDEFQIKMAQLRRMKVYRVTLEPGQVLGMRGYTIHAGDGGLKGEASTRVHFYGSEGYVSDVTCFVSSLDQAFLHQCQPTSRPQRHHQQHLIWPIGQGEEDGGIYATPEPYLPPACEPVDDLWEEDWALDDGKVDGILLNLLSHEEEADAAEKAEQEAQKPAKPKRKRRGVQQDPVVRCQDSVSQDPVGVQQDPVAWCQDPVGVQQDPVGVQQDPVGKQQDPVGQDPEARCQDPVGQDPVDPVVWCQDPVGQEPVVWCPDPVVWCQDPVGQEPVVWCQDPVVWCQDPVGQNPVDPVVWCQDPVVWCQDPVGHNPVVRCQDPVVPGPCGEDPVGQNPVLRNQDPVVWCQDPVDPVVRCQDPVSQNPVVWCQDPVWEGTHRRTLYRVLAHIDKSIQTGSTEPTQAMKES
ncbi:hypothetical protein QJQ45_003963 [Haematococcus lacustris]|nr:hypothetical protein QJQ45_003963 [Haematococcus lacustris]